MTILLADVHLSPAVPARGRRLASLLERLPAGTDIWVLGDLVDVWLEGPDWDVAETVPEIRLLGRHRARFIPGNTDFLAGPRFAAATGARLLGEEALVEAEGARALATHGDLLCRRDRRYRLWRRAARSGLVRALAGGLGRRRSEALAARLRHLSAAEVARKRPETTDADAAEARRRLDRVGARTMIAGHVHRPGVRDLGGGRHLLLLGHWDAGGEVAVRAGAGWALVRPEDLVS